MLLLSFAVHVTCNSSNYTNILLLRQNRLLEYRHSSAFSSRNLSSSTPSCWRWFASTFKLSASSSRCHILVFGLAKHRFMAANTNKTENIFLQVAMACVFLYSKETLTRFPSLHQLSLDHGMKCWLYQHHL